MKIINEITDKKGSQPDPFIICDDGRFYIYCTGGDGVYCYRSNTLDNFDYIGKVMCQKGQKEYWAPCVIKADGSSICIIPPCPSKATTCTLRL